MLTYITVDIKDELDIRPVKWIDEVLSLVLTREPIPWQQTDLSPDENLAKKTKSGKKSIEAH